MINRQITKVYSDIHSYVAYTGDAAVSFDGSQVQYEFFEAWSLISKFFAQNMITDKLTFLEVGAWKGLWGIAFCEFCKQNNIDGKYVTITMIDQDPNNQPLYKTIDYINSQGISATLIDMNTLDDNALAEVLKHETSFNIVFIDADHTYDAVKSDINKFSGLATDILLFHDIRPKHVTQHCGVYQAILDSGIKLDEEIVTNESLMGIGIKYVNRNVKP